MRLLLILIATTLLTGLGLTGDVGLSYAQQDAGLVLESHVGARPRDADYLLAPLLDELKENGFRGSSVAGTRIHSKHSLSSEELSSKELSDVRQTVKDAHAAYLDFRFEGAIHTANQAIAQLMSRPATMARQQEVREYLYQALITSSMAHSRLGNKLELEASMTEFIRSFPKRDVSIKKYGPEGRDLYRDMNKRLQQVKKGRLQIAAAPGAMIFLNEVYQGIGSLNAELFPGRYRVYTQNGPQAGRVHIVTVESEREQTLVVDPVLDSALRTSGKIVGFVFEDEESRAEHEKRVALQLGRALGAEKVILVGFHKFKGRDSIVANSILIRDGETGPSARVPLPKNGAPSASQLRALASFVSGAKPASGDIQVLSTAPNTPIEPRKSARTAAARGGEDVSVNGRTSKDAAGINSAWRWSSWTLGAAGLGVGSYLVAIHDTGTCDENVCPENYDTLVPGIGLLAGGAAFGLLGFYLWGHEGTSEKPALSLAPSSGGWAAAVSGSF